MHEETTKNAAEEVTLEERSNLIQSVSSPSSYKPASDSNDHEVKEPSSASVHNDKTEKNVGLFLSKTLDKKVFCEGFVYVRGQWTSRSDIGVNGYGWIFKLVLWCFRYKTG